MRDYEITYDIKSAESADPVVGLTQTVTANNENDAFKKAKELIKRNFGRFGAIPDRLITIRRVTWIVQRK